MHLVSTKLVRSGVDSKPIQTTPPIVISLEAKTFKVRTYAPALDALQPFLTEEAAKKMAPVGSSQRNECLNSVIESKVPKIQHYGGSESSDHRTAAGVAQFKVSVYPK